MDYRCPVPESPITESKCCNLERALTFKYVKDLKRQSEAFELVLLKDVKRFKYLFKDGKDNHHVDLSEHFPSLEIPSDLPEIDQVRYASTLLIDFTRYLHLQEDGFDELMPYIHHILEALDLVIQTAGNGDTTVDVSYVKPTFDEIPRVIKAFYEESKALLNVKFPTEILDNGLVREKQMLQDLKEHAIIKQLRVIIGQLRTAVGSLHGIFL